MSKVCFTLLMVMVALVKGLSQSAIVSVGGGASGINGNISYSAGEIDFINLTNTINAGVQQAYDSIAALPVKFLTIKAIKQGKSVLVKWQTASENNSSHFLVYRSANSTEFNYNIGRVPAAGYSEKVLDYSLLDKSPATDLNYYRIKQVDKDGKEMYSAIVAVDIDAGINVWVYPNPATAFIKLQVDASDISRYSYALYDINGKQLQGSHINAAISTINMKELKSASYSLRINNNGTTVSSFIIIKK